jgi:ketosteroid isomerase-like protein
MRRVLAGSNEEAAVDAIDESRALYSELLIAGDVEAWANLHTPDVVKMGPNGPPARGRAELIESMSRTLEAMEFASFDIDAEETVILGDVAYSWCMYTWKARPRGGGDPILYDGKALSIYQRQPDGSWLLSHDCFNSNVPPPAP